LALLVSAARAETDAKDLYVRRVGDIPGAVRKLLDRTRHTRTTLFVLDTATFAPPPGRNEFKMDHRYRADAPRWLEALSREVTQRKRRCLVGLTTSARVVEVGADGWRQAVRRDLARRWWAEKRGLGSAVSWMRRFLKQAGGPGPPTGDGAKRALVLVTGDILPEQWVIGHFGTEPESWRPLLSPVGGYWEEEKIGALLAQARCPLFLVAPEARFGDATPVTELPELPWAARPVLPAAGIALGPRLLGSRDLDDILKGKLPDRLRREILSALRDGLDGLAGTRFDATTPTWYPFYGHALFFNTDCPSAFGYWPFARAAARSGGHYLFYPFPAGKWLDRCPYEPALLMRLAPELGPAREFVRRRAGDPALQALCAASRLVVADTPWEDALGARWAKGWGSFASVTPPRLERRFRLRRKPFDAALQGPVAELRSHGRRLARLLPRYDQAVRTLARAQTRIATSEVERPHRRAEAHLRLGRFWFEMSAFHLEALALYLQEIERFLPPGWKKGDPYHVTYVNTIRLSDCLEGYEQRTLPPAKEKRYRRWLPTNAPGYQGNILEIRPRDPAYRARRQLPAVFKHLDARLQPRALRTIDAAAAVMKHEGRSPWGWMVYYSELFTFICKPVRGLPGEVQRKGQPEEDWDGPTTPRRGGSSPGGARTGG
jgi:hypothetical protein